MSKDVKKKNNKLIGGNSPVSNVLIEASFVIKNNKSRNSCDHRRYINYCALDEAENSNICQGDSGGPLQYFENGKWFVYGLSSFTISNEETSCVNTEPSFFTTVPFYLGWIKRVSTRDPSPPFVKKKCGLNSRPRIVGGKISKNNAWPWIVQIRLFRDNFFEFPLNGTLVSDQHGKMNFFFYPDLDKLYSAIDIRQVSNELVILKLHRPITTAGWGSINGKVDSSPTALRETRLTKDNKRNECKIGKQTNICYEDIGNPLMFPVANKWTLFGVFYQFSTDSSGNCNQNKMSLAYNIIKDLDSIKSALN
ncbi:unnamed protein product [Brachionus calyciflorus]|uniref:Peptidase S1 domain-containing protein n=1 Tax=Brachionus calyciflorus TaxID=104777 RepID=A0A814IYD9_9BILA|nr:unnamed protein product [Brachionus calyciflorus]